MPIVVFCEDCAKYKALPYGLGYFSCKECHIETPHNFDYCEGGFSARCNVCCNMQKFGRFALHDKCRMFIEVLGFVAKRESRALFFKNLYGDQQQEIFIPIMEWSSLPVKHICGQAIDIQKIPP